MLQDIISAKSLPTTPTDDQRWAIEKIQEYQYRKMFHLSERDFLEESFASYTTNMNIKAMLDKQQSREMKRASRKSRRK